MLVFSNTSVSQTNSNPFIVVLDAGHGGKDPGRPTDFGYKEKDIALDIVLKIGNNLEKIEDIKALDLDYVITVNPGCTRQLVTSLRRAKVKTRVLHIAQLIEMAVN